MTSRSQPSGGAAAQRSTGLNPEPSASEREAYRLHLIATQGVTLTASLEGIALHYGGDVIDVFPTFLGAKKGLLIALEANALLSDCLNRRSAL